MLIASFTLGSGLEEPTWWGRGEDGGEKEGERICAVRCGWLPGVGEQKSIDAAVIAS